MSQSYDKIFRENIEELVVPLATKLLNLSIPALEEIPDDLQVTVERKPDFLKKVIHPKPSLNYILHFEFQTVDDSGMAERMLEYFAMLYRKYHLPVKQYVFYIGSGPSRMQTQIKEDNIAFRYSLLNTTDVDYRLFLKSTVPEEVLLAILGDFSDDSSEIVLTSLLTRLREVETRPLRLARYIKQLEVLSKLRKLQKLTVQISKKMALVYDLETDIRYRQGLRKGVKKGKEEGREEVIMNLLKHSAFTVEQIATALGLTVPQVQQIVQKTATGK